MMRDAWKIEINREGGVVHILDVNMFGDKQLIAAVPLRNTLDGLDHPEVVKIARMIASLPVLVEAAETALRRGLRDNKAGKEAEEDILRAFRVMRGEAEWIREAQ